MGRVVLFGATGYTGRLTAEALTARGVRPLLAGRSAGSLAKMASAMDGLETALADVADPAAVRALLEPGDVMLATVGPFARFGDPAAEAAIDAGACYLDSTGEPAFIRRVFEEFGPRASVSGASLVTAFGFDWVPGNLAGALALREAGASATRVDVGYFSTGGMGGMSGGTRASLAGAVVDPAFEWRDGIRTQRPAARVRYFDAAGKRRPALSVGSSEHFSLPRMYSGLREVNVYLGWFGGASRAMQAFSAVNAGITKIPGARAGIEALTSRLVKGSTGGPDAEARAGTGSAIAAIAHSPEGDELASVSLTGVNGYEFTGRILAWGSERALGAGMRGTGALGPAEAFGLDELEAGCAEAGLRRGRA
jgi:short subunit dehydrogenase-like uncharacterized protein